MSPFTAFPISGEGSIKNLVYEAEKRHPRLSAIYALLMECARHEQQLSASVRLSRLLEREPKLDAGLALILITELVYGRKRLPGNSRPVQGGTRRRHQCMCYCSRESIGVWSYVRARTIR